jgi:hypothetical protein
MVNPANRNFKLRSGDNKPIWGNVIEYRVRTDQ